MIGETGTNKNQLQAINVDFVHELLTRADDAGVAHVVLASSAAVYGLGRGEPFDENTNLSPMNSYGRSKAVMEDLAQDLAARGKAPPITVLRVANVTGSDALITAAQAAVAADKPMTIHRFPSGKAALRSYIGPEDLYHCVSALAAMPPSTIQTINICAPKPVRVDTLAQSYKDTLFPDLAFDSGPAPSGTPEEVVLSTSALESVVSFGPEASQTNEMAQQVAKDLNS